MTIQEFIQENRAELIGCVQSVCNNCSVGDDDLEDWINNNEELYNWARECGVTYE